MKHIAFVLFPEFQMLAYVLGTETLRLANKCAGAQAFSWHTLSVTNAPVRASNGSIVSPDNLDWQDGPHSDLILLCAGYHPLAHVTPRLRAYLARHRSVRHTIGGVDTGTVILAHLGLLDGYRAVLHHEAETAFRESWPDIKVADQIYSLDRQRLTAAGGTATGDAMLAWIGREVSEILANATATAMSHGQIRRGEEAQRSLTLSDPVLHDMDHVMRLNLSSPMGIAALSRQLHVSPKQLLRRCKLGHGLTPTEYYLNLRVEEAALLLANTYLSVTEIAFATGFGSPSGLSRAFKRRFGMSPRASRRG